MPVFLKCCGDSDNALELWKKELGALKKLDKAETRCDFVCDFLFSYDEETGVDMLIKKSDGGNQKSSFKRFLVMPYYGDTNLAQYIQKKQAVKTQVWYYKSANNCLPPTKS